MVCLGFKPGAAGWLARTKPRSYGGHPSFWAPGHFFDGHFFDGHFFDGRFFDGTFYRRDSLSTGHIFDVPIFSKIFSHIFSKIYIEIKIDLTTHN